MNSQPDKASASPRNDREETVKRLRRTERDNSLSGKKNGLRMLFFPYMEKVSSQGHTVNAGIFSPAPARNITEEKGADI